MIKLGHNSVYQIDKFEGNLLLRKRYCVGNWFRVFINDFWEILKEEGEFSLTEDDWFLGFCAFEDRVDLIAIKVIKGGNVLEDMLFPLDNEAFGEIVKRKSADEANQHHKEIV